MMKKILLSVFLTGIFILTLQAQAIITVQSENFDAAGIPAGWTTNIVAGVDDWQFGVSPAGSLNGTGMAYFDDDAIGSGAAASTVELLSPVVDLSALTFATLDFDYNYRHLSSSFDVEVFNGAAWINVLSVTSNDCGAWGNCTYPHATIDISAHLNANFQVRFTFADSNNWAWYVGMDNFEITAPGQVFSDDMIVEGFITPDSLLCSYGSSELVVVQLKNIGQNPASGVQVSLWVDGTFIVTDNIFVPTVAPGNSAFHIMSQQADLSAAGQHTLMVAVASPTEVNPGNDTLTQTFGQGFINTYPYSESFDTWNPCASNCNDLSCQNSPNTAGWSQVDDIGTNTADWNTLQGSTGTGNTGPSSDHTSGSGRYIYTEASGCSNNVMTVESPCFEITGLAAPQASFWYHMWGGQTGTIEFQVDAGAGFTTIWSLSGDQGNLWDEAVISLTPYIGQVIVCRIVGTTGSGLESDMAIDDFRIGEAPAFDVGVTALIAPAIGGCTALSSAELVTVEITNTGASNATTMDLNLTVNGTLVASEQYVGNIPPNGTDNYTFTTPIDLTAPGQIIITATAATSPLDERPWNDAFTALGFNDGASIVSTYPYMENFDAFSQCALFSCNDGGCGNVAPTPGWRNELGDASDWSVNSGSTGTNGTGPEFDHTQGVTGSGNYIYTEAAFGCTNSAMSFVSPCLDLTALAAPEASFWYHMFGNSVGTLNFEVDSSGTGAFDVVWTLSGAQGNQWNEAVVDLTPYAGKVIKARFTGITGTGTSSDIGVDDFLMREVLAHDLQVVEVTGAATGCGDVNQMVEVKLFNYGFTTETDYSVQVDMTGATNTTITENVTTPLVTEDSIIVTVGPFNTSLGGPVNFTATVTINNASDADASNDVGMLDITSTALSVLVPVDGTRCGAGPVDLSTTGNATEYFWYEDSLGGEYINQGAAYTTPYLTEDKTYWVEGRNPFTSNVGVSDRFSEEGGYYDFYTDGLRFDTEFDITINKVTVYPQFPGDIVVNLVDNAGNLMETKTFQFGGTVVDTVLTLDFDVPVGTGFELNAAGSNTLMYRNRNLDNTFDISYPLTLPGACEITGPINNQPGSYYFFYNWEVTFLGCPSPRMPVEAVLGSSGLTGSITTIFSLAGFNTGTATVNATGGTLPYTYSWSNGDTTQQATQLAGDSTAYTVTVTDVNGCAEIFDAAIFTVGTNNLSMIENLQVYPNPTDGTFNVDLEMDKVHEVRIEVMNVLGQVVYSSTPEHIAAKRYPIDLSRFASGMYQVRIRIDNEIITKSVMKAD